MTPMLADAPYGIISVATVGSTDLAKCFAVIKEEEGLTLIAERAMLENSGHQISAAWARITLQIHSSLEAVGLTAAFATALGNVGISANVVAAFHHDHIFVQWDKRQEALQALKNLSLNH